jgi:drug/metabolite transporter (DMT)-like permease
LSPLFLALGASLAWGVADFVGPVRARTLGALRVLLWAQVGGLTAIGLTVAVRGDGPQGWAVAYAMLAACAGTLGIYAYYRGVAIGAMSVVAPIAGAASVIPVLFGIATGDRPSAVQIGGVVCAVVGVALASQEHQEGERHLAAGVGLAILAAIGLGCYVPPMHAAGKVDFWWSALVFRATTLVLVSAAVAVSRPALRLGRRDMLVCLLVGVGDTLGNILFAASSRSGLISLTSVLASLFPIVTIALAAFVLRERIASAQRLGVVLTLAGVLLISGG